MEEVLYVTDMDAAFAVAGPVRKEAYGSAQPAVASTILVTPRLALPQQLIEIKARRDRLARGSRGREAPPR